MCTRGPIFGRNHHDQKVQARRAVISWRSAPFPFLRARPLGVGSSPTPRLRRPPRERRGCGLCGPVIRRNSEIRLFSPMTSNSAGPCRVLRCITIFAPGTYTFTVQSYGLTAGQPEGRDPAGTRNADLSGDLVGRQLVDRYCRGGDLFVRTLPSDLGPAYVRVLTDKGPPRAL